MRQHLAEGDGGGELEGPRYQRPGGNHVEQREGRDARPEERHDPGANPGDTHQDHPHQTPTGLPASGEGMAQREDAVDEGEGSEQEHECRERQPRKKERQNAENERRNCPQRNPPPISYCQLTHHV